MIIAYDLGTSGLKASLHHDDGGIIASSFHAYPTFFPAPGFQEQRPADWRDAVCGATRALLAQSGARPNAAALSGQSLAPVLMDSDGNLILESVPIWCDTRATAETQEFFTAVDYKEWYLATGNGDPPETYTIMKLMWLKRHYPEACARTSVVLGSKDYVNYILTGKTGTDFSYASGSGVFDLEHLCYRDDFCKAAGISRNIFPPPLASHQIVGRVTPEAAVQSGMPEGIPVALGGVDNACMSLGALGLEEGRAYMSLGSSAWIAVTSKKPVLDLQTRPFVFAHAEKGLYTSGVSIFAAGSAYRWASEELCADLPQGGERFQAMDKLAAKSVPGANGVLFNPALSGGSGQEPGAGLRGAFLGLRMASTRGDLLRAVMEGVAFSMENYCMRALRRHVDINGGLAVCGGGAESAVWSQIFADVFNMPVLLNRHVQNAASLGAAAIAARAAGLWKDYAPLEHLLRSEKEYKPIAANTQLYKRRSDIFDQWTRSILPFCEQLNALLEKEEPRLKEDTDE
ncbi:MAG: pentose kinase [Clostridiales bacterium]|jgi:xylulokinase|nr:pentose kinase [Clostridiales bacterium]